MAKTNMIARGLKRAELEKKGRSTRAKLKATIKDQNVSHDERMSAKVALNKRKKDESKVRIRRRCRICGRARGVYRKFALCRVHLREEAALGNVPGLVKASW